MLCYQLPEREVHVLVIGVKKGSVLYIGRSRFEI